MTVDQINSLIDFCKQSRKFSRPPREDTFFSIGGRGYYENPTSDLLAFFMSDGDHGFKQVFLGALLSFLDLRDEAIHSMLLDEVFIERERKTDRGNRLDLRLLGNGWGIIIENKVRHWLANDLEDYRSSSLRWAESQNIPEDCLHFVVLSPEAIQDIPSKWRSVTYKNFIKSTREILEHTEIEDTKWRTFALDFILHIEQEICNTTMNLETILFIDSHLKDLANIRNLQNEYMHYLDAELHQTLLNRRSVKPEILWKSNYFWVRSSNREVWQLGLSGPNHLPLDSDGSLLVRIWTTVEGEALESIKSEHFNDFKKVDMVEGFHEFQKKYDSSSEALKKIGTLTRELLE